MPEARRETCEKMRRSNVNAAAVAIYSDVDTRVELSSALSGYNETAAVCTLARSSS